MRLLQRLARRFASDRATRALVALDPRAQSLAELERIVARAEDTRRRDPTHFGLTYALGRAWEILASVQSWDARGPPLERAVAAYEASVDLALRGEVTGATAIPEVDAARWETGLGVERRALLAASVSAGVLRAAEFRVRDPARAVEHLRRVVAELRGYHLAWYFLGEAHLLAGEFDDAERVWRRAQELAPDQPALKAVLANLPVDRVRHCVKAGDWAGVLRELERLPEGAMRPSERLTLAGDAHLALGDARRARECWYAALADDLHAVGVRKRLRNLARRSAVPSRSADQPRML